MVEWSSHFDVVFETLGYSAIFKPRRGEEKNVTVLCRQPENLYEVGDSKSVAQISDLVIRKSEISRINVGDLIKIGSNTYKIYEEPLLDTSNLLWNLKGYLV